MSKTIEEKIAVMQAFVDGKTIQAMDHGYADWDDCPRPVWDWLNTDYRIKPEEPEWIPQWGEAVWVSDQPDSGWVEAIYAGESGLRVQPHAALNGESVDFWMFCKPRPQPIFIRKDGTRESSPYCLKNDAISGNGKSAPIELINVESQDNE